MREASDRSVNSYIAVMARMSAVHFAAKFGKYNIGAGEHRIIDFVCQNPGSNQDDLSTNFRMNKGATSRMVQSVVKKGFITAKVSPKDKRQRLLFPTEMGIKIFPALVAAKWDWEDKIMRDMKLPREEVIALLSVLETTMKTLINEEKAEGRGMS